jgi:hypothetical protein
VEGVDVKPPGIIVDFVAAVRDQHDGELKSYIAPVTCWRNRGCDHRKRLATAPIPEAQSHHLPIRSADPTEARKA